MHDILLQFLSYARGAWRFRWFAQLVAWPICLVGWALLYTMPNQYQSTARVYVDTQSLLRPLLQGLAVQSDVNVQVRSMMRTLLSRPNLEKVARITDLDLEAHSPEELERLITALSQRITLVNVGQDNIYAISYTHTNPDTAKNVVQSVLTLFVESSLGTVRTDTTAAQQFLDSQIKEYEARLFSAEESLKDFKRTNVSVMPSEGRGYYDRLQAEVALLERAKLDLREAEHRRDELQRQLSGEEPTFGLVSQAQAPSALSVSSIERRIQPLETQLDELLLKYTESHPDVVTLRAQIADLRGQEKKRQDGLPQSTTSQPLQALETNPVYQQLKVALGSAEADVAGLSTRVAQYQERVNHLGKMVDTVPQVEAELARLNRDYAINKQNYELLISRREQAKISEQADQSSDTMKFKIVDPPNVPLTPVSPHRMLFATAILILGIGAGVGIALLLAQLKPTFDNHRLFFAQTNVPVLGYVSQLMSDDQRRRQRLGVLSYGAAGVALIIAYGIYLVINMMHASGMQ